MQNRKQIILKRFLVYSNNKADSHCIVGLCLCLNILNEIGKKCVVNTRLNNVLHLLIEFADVKDATVARVVTEEFPPVSVCLIA